MFSEWQIVNAYALGILHRSNPNKVFLAGFDGFKNNLIKNEEIEKIFLKYKSLKNSKQLFSITPTEHSSSILKKI